MDISSSIRPYGSYLGVLDENKPTPDSKRVLKRHANKKLSLNTGAAYLATRTLVLTSEFFEDSWILVGNLCKRAGPPDKNPTFPNILPARQNFRQWLDNLPPQDR